MTSETKQLIAQLAEALAEIRAVMADLPELPKLTTRESFLDIENTPLGDPLPEPLSVYGRIRTLAQLESGVRLLAMATGAALREMRREFLRLPPELRDALLSEAPPRDRYHLDLDLSSDRAPIVKIAGGGR